jgi:hypothetical protein
MRLVQLHNGTLPIAHTSSVEYPQVGDTLPMLYKQTGALIRWAVIRLKSS